MGSYYAIQYGYDSAGYLMHFGIKGQKWGIRRFQNPDGTLTEEGLRRYGRSIERGNRLLDKGYTKGKVIAGGVGRQALMTATAFIGSAAAAKYSSAINNAAFDIGNKFVDRANKILEKVPKSDFMLWRLGQQNQEVLNNASAFKRKVADGLKAASKTIPESSRKTIERSKALADLGNNVALRAFESELEGKVVPYVGQLGAIGYGIGTAANAAKTIRDYRDIRNAEIARGLDKRKKK